MGTCVGDELHSRATWGTGLRKVAEYISISFANDGFEKFVFLLVRKAFV
jgi:hypothetical protein